MLILWDRFLHMRRLDCCVSEESRSLLIPPAGLPLFLSSVIITKLITKLSIILCNLFVLHFFLFSFVLLLNINILFMSMFKLIPGLSLQVCNNKLFACLNHCIIALWPILKCKFCFYIQDSQGNPSGCSNLLQSWECEGPHHFQEDIPVKQRLTLMTLQDGHNTAK